MNRDQAVAIVIHKHTPAADDALHLALVRAVERRTRRYLWVPEDAVTFVPRVLPVVYGDGRALFKVMTNNQRPQYWVVRGCSTWRTARDVEVRSGVDFCEITDEIIDDLEEAFGRGRCSYMGNSLFFGKRERTQTCQCEQCSDVSFRARWPMVDYDGGLLWGRMDWPTGVQP